jgi:hypothetical protein
LIFLFILPGQLIVMSKRQNYISTFLGDFFLGLTAYKNAYAFIREHRLWDGMTRYKGIIVIFILIGLVLGVKIFDIVQNMVQTRGHLRNGAHQYNEYG